MLMYADAQMSKANPFKSSSPDGLSVLSLPPILLLGVVVNIKERVARYVCWRMLAYADVC